MYNINICINIYIEKDTTACGAATNPPTGITDASGKFNRFFNKSLSSATSIKFKAVISLAILSIFGFTDLSSTFDRGGGGGAACVAAAALDSVRRTMLKATNT